VGIIRPDELLAEFPDQRVGGRNPFTLRVTLSHRGLMHEIGLVPDLVFGLVPADGSRRQFMVEIDRGTMPITRSDVLRQTSFEEKMRVSDCTRRQTSRTAIRLEYVPRPYSHDGRSPGSVYEERASWAPGAAQPWRFSIPFHDA
jgi:hypothetical protein